MRLIATLVLLICSQAFAGEYVKKKLQVDFHGDNNGNRIYYRCESALKMAEGHLRLLGATSIASKCSGGVESYDRVPYWTPLSIKAEFDVPVSVERVSFETVTINAENQVHEDCFLNVAFLEAALPLFPGVKTIKKKNICLNNYTPWTYTVRISK